MWRIVCKRSTGTQSSTEPEIESSNFWIGLRTLEERRQERVTEIIKRDWNIDLKTAFIMVTYTIHTALQGPRSRVYLGFKLGKNRISLFWSESKFSVLSTYLVLQRLRKNLKFFFMDWPKLTIFVPRSLKIEHELHSNLLIFLDFWNTVL